MGLANGRLGAGSRRFVDRVWSERAVTPRIGWRNDCGKVCHSDRSPVLPLADAPENGPAIWQIMRTNGSVLPTFSESRSSFDLRQTTTDLLRKAANPKVIVLDVGAPFENPGGSIRYFQRNRGLLSRQQPFEQDRRLELRPLLEPFFREAGKQDPLR